MNEEKKPFDLQRRGELYYEAKTGCYALPCNAKDGDAFALSSLFKYADYILLNEDNNIVIATELFHKKFGSYLFFMVSKIDEGLEFTVKESSPELALKKFCIAVYEKNVMIITESGKVLSGCDLVDGLVKSRSADELRGQHINNLSNAFFHGFAAYAVTAELYIRPMRDLLKDDRIKTSDQFTYLILDRGNLLTKIGRSADLYRRMGEFLNANKNLTFIAHCSGGENEVKLHHQYRAKNVSKEWYRLSKEDIENIIKEYNMKCSHTSWKKFFK